MEIFELAKELKDTPLPIILAFAGLLFVYLYINDKFAKKIRRIVSKAKILFKIQGT